MDISAFVAKSKFNKLTKALSNLWLKDSEFVNGGAILGHSSGGVV